MDTKTYKTLHTRLLAVILCMSLMPLLALGWFCADRINALHADKLSTALASVTRNKARAVDTFLSERVAQIRTLTYTHSYTELINPHRLSEIFNTVQHNSQSYIDIGVIGRNGGHLAYVGPYELQHTNYKQELWFQEVMHKGVYVSDVFLGFRKVPHFIIAVMRHEGDQTYIVRATIDFAPLNALVRRPYEGTSSDAFLLNTKGQLQTVSRFHGDVMDTLALTLPEPSQPANSLHREDALGPVPVNVYDTQNKVEYLATVMPIAVVPWRLVLLEDTRQALGALQQLRLYVLLFVLGGAVIMVFGALAVSRAIVRHLEELDRNQAHIDAQMIQSSKMAALGKMAAGVAHEINNPLTLIRESAGWINDLLDEESEATVKNLHELRDTSRKIEEHVDRAKTITKRMLGFGRAMNPDQAEVFVPALLDQTIEFLSTEAKLRNISIERDYATGLDTIATDAGQLQQVFLNIIDNALDAVEKDGKVTVSVQPLSADARGAEAIGRNEGVCVRITDTGPGIPPDKLARIFDPFFTTKKVGEGTGLGLAICFTILESLGGFIRVESEVGKGSAFVIALPRERSFTPKAA